MKNSKPFYELSKPYPIGTNIVGHVNYRVDTIVGRDVSHRVDAGADPDEILYLHDDGTVKDGGMAWGTSPNFTSIDKAYLAINNYYAANGRPTPYVRVEGAWRDCSPLSNNGQTTQPQIMSTLNDILYEYPEWGDLPVTVHASDGSYDFIAGRARVYVVEDDVGEILVFAAN